MLLAEIFVISIWEFFNTIGGKETFAAAGTDVCYLDQFPSFAHPFRNFEFVTGDKRASGRGIYHPQTQGKIERWHQTLKNRILLENYFLPGDLEAKIEAFVDHYNHQRYHESLNNVTPSDVYFGRAQAILNKRERIKRKTLENRRLQHRKLAA